MSKLRSLGVFYWLVTSLLSGCTYSYTKDLTHSALAQAGWGDDYQARRTNAFTLPAGSTVYLTYPNSSAQISKAIPRFRSLFQEAMMEVGRSRGLQGVAGPYPQTEVNQDDQPADYQQDFHQALKEARARNCDFIFTVVVTDLQSGNNKSRKNNDGFTLMLSVYDVRSRALVDTFSVTAERGVSPKKRSANELIYSSASALIDRLYTPPRV